LIRKKPQALRLAACALQLERKPQQAQPLLRSQKFVHEDNWSELSLKRLLSVALLLLMYF